jgi:hypothetical protein
MNNKQFYSLIGTMVVLYIALQLALLMSTEHTQKRLNDLNLKMVNLSSLYDKQMQLEACNEDIHNMKSEIQLMEINSIEGWRMFDKICEHRAEECDSMEEGEEYGD